MDLETMTVTQETQVTNKSVVTNFPFPALLAFQGRIGE